MARKSDFAARLAAHGPQADYAEPSLAEARAYCRRLARGHYENFWVATWLLPREVRPAFHALYAYCRWADDLADEAADPRQALEWLDWWQQQLEACYQGRARHPVFVALAETIRGYALPRQALVDLLTAFRRDQSQTEYETAADLVDYCRYSANPVGRLVLHIAGVPPDEPVPAEPLDPEARAPIDPHDPPRLSDAICTGLQWVNHCQDVWRDYRRGRIYLPQASFREFGYDPRDLEYRKFNDPFRRLLQHETNRAERFLLAGRPLVERVPDWLRADLGLFVAGGLETVAAIRRRNHNVLARRPTVSRRTQLRLLWQQCCRLRLQRRRGERNRT